MKSGEVVCLTDESIGFLPFRLNRCQSDHWTRNANEVKTVTVAGPVGEETATPLSVKTRVSGYDWVLEVGEFLGGMWADDRM